MYPIGTKVKVIRGFDKKQGETYIDQIGEIIEIDIGQYGDTVGQAKWNPYYKIKDELGNIIECWGEELEVIWIK